MANVTSLLTSLCDNFKNPASTSNTGTLPSQTVTNPHQQINAITIRSDSLNTAAGGNLLTRNTQDALTIIENKARVRTCRNKPQLSSSGGTSTQIDAITVLTKQVEALEYHFASMRETYDPNQETSNQLMQNQMGQMEEIFQERQSCVLPSNTDPHAELKVITSTDGLTLDGSFLSHSNFLEKTEPETIMKVVEIASSKSTPLVPPPETPPLSAPNTLRRPEANLISHRFISIRSKKKNFSLENLYDVSTILLSIDNTLSHTTSLTPSGEIDLLLAETDAFLSLDDSIPPGIDNGIYDSEGDILFLEELLHDGIPKDLPPKEP
ncbi:hypothetical protein Tco_1008888 [Tanacetum coccineum]